MCMAGVWRQAMATSDNVVRAGLTPKLRDVDTLCQMLTCRQAPPPLPARSVPAPCSPPLPARCLATAWPLPVHCLSTAWPLPQHAAVCAHRPCILSSALPSEPHRSGASAKMA